MGPAARASLFAALIGAAVGCREEKSAAPPAAVTQAVQKAEDDLLARRDALLAVRRQISNERMRLNEKRSALARSGADTAAVDAEASALLDRERKLVEEEQALNKLYEQVIRQRREMVQTLAGGGDETARISAREGAMADREKDVARRESQLAGRERELAERERELARRERETCSAVPTTIVRTIDVKGAKYGKGDVDPLLKQARSKMSKKGVLPSDLPAPAQGLEREATSAMAEGDFGRARFAAAQLVDSVDALRVDKQFIAGKIDRLNGAIKGVQLSPDLRSKVDALFREATSAYGDGNFAGANGRLNKIYGMIR
jgi:hypothetical protein